MKPILASPPQPARHHLEPARWSENHRDYLIQFALKRVHDHGQAEDLVQDSFLSAWNARGTFRGDCSERTWLTGVLKNKIVDHWRRVARRPLILAGDFERDEDGGSDVPWLENVPGRGTFPDPEGSVDRAEMMALVRAAVDRLPGAMGQAFRMREFQGKSTEEITSTLKISKANLWVLIHRARQLLRHQLAPAWLGEETGTKNEARLAA